LHQTPSNFPTLFSVGSTDSKDSEKGYEMQEVKENRKGCENGARRQEVRIQRPRRKKKKKGSKEEGIRIEVTREARRDSEGYGIEIQMKGKRTEEKKIKFEGKEWKDLARKVRYPVKKDGRFIRQGSSKKS